MKNYFLITILLCTVYTQAAQVGQKRYWFCCSAQDMPKKPSARVIHSLNTMPNRTQWEQKKEIIRKQILKGIHPDTLRYGEQNTYFPLYEAIAVHYDQQFTKFLLEHGADPNQSKDGKHLIFHATAVTVHMLLDHNANPLVKNPLWNQETVLHAHPLDHQLIKRYCEIGWDPCTVDNLGQTTLHSLIRDECWCMCSTCLKKQPRYECLALLIHIGTPFDRPASEGPYKGMPFNKIIEDRYYQDSLVDYTQTIKTAVRERKKAIEKSAGLMVTKDPLGIVLAYDGQTSNVEDWVKLLPLTDHHGDTPSC